MSKLLEQHPARRAAGENSLASRSVDMAHPTDPAPAAGSGPPQPPVAVNARLSPLQVAWDDYTRHAITCPVCCDVGAGRCGEAEGLWRAYQAAGADAYRRLGEGA